MDKLQTSMDATFFLGGGGKLSGRNLTHPPLKLCDLPGSCPKGMLTNILLVDETGSSNAGWEPK